MTEFDASRLHSQGWRQGSILGATLRDATRKHAPRGVVIEEGDCLVIVSHDCDVVSMSLAKEPYVEVVLLRPASGPKQDKNSFGGRNPRSIQLAWDGEHGNESLWAASVHDRWVVPRELLHAAEPAGLLGEKERRLIAGWLAKRYVRSAFPTAFDQRWRARMRHWTRLLERESAWIMGVYLLLDSLDEKGEDEPYRIEVLIALPATASGVGGYAEALDRIESDVRSFWETFGPGIEVDEVDVRRTDEITINELERMQRFDADWVSFADETETVPLAVDLGR